jgi:hypothetical protein
VHLRNEAAQQHVKKMLELHHPIYSPSTRQISVAFMTQDTTQHQPPPLPAARPRVMYAAYFPFVAAVLELPWMAILVVATLMTTGKFDPNASQTRLLDILSVIPSLIGIAIGIRLLRSAEIQRRTDRIFLFVGLALCTLFIAPFVWEFFHP